VGEGFALNSVCGAHRVTCSVYNDWFLKTRSRNFGKSRFKMHWVVATWLITSLIGLGMGHNTLFEGRKNLLMLSKYVSPRHTEKVSKINMHKSFDEQVHNEISDI